MSKDNGGPASDRELLEMAAKAAGIKAGWFKVRTWNGCIGARCHAGTKDVFGTSQSKPWNPLTDGADALRLAVNLRITVAMHADAVAAMHTSSGRSWCESYEGDKHAATRRAIVRAAAAIGSAM